MKIKLTSEEKRYVVVESARRLTPLNLDILKGRIPVRHQRYRRIQVEGCLQRDLICSVTPWILLSAAVDYETYVRQVTVACTQAPAGSRSARAVWKGSRHNGKINTPNIPEHRATERLARLTSCATHSPNPGWHFTQLRSLDSHWYAEY